MSDPNTPNPSTSTSTSNRTTQDQDTGQRISDALETTGKRLQEEVSAAGDRVKQFVEDKNINEQIEVAGGQVVERVRGLVEEGNVRRLILRNPEGRVLLEIPLTAGVAVGGALLWLNPLLAGLGAIAALIARVTIEIVREEPAATIKDVKDAAEKTKNNLTG